MENDSGLRGPAYDPEGASTVVAERGRSWAGSVRKRGLRIEGCVITPRMNCRPNSVSNYFCNTSLQGVGVQSVKLPPRSPNLNAYAERFVRSIQESSLERMILFGEETVAGGHSEFHRALSYRAQSSGAGESAHPPRGRSSWKHRHDPETPAPRWHAELLLPYSRLSWSPMSSLTACRNATGRVLEGSFTTIVRGVLSCQLHSMMVFLFRPKLGPDSLHIGHWQKRRHLE